MKRSVPGTQEEKASQTEAFMGEQGLGEMSVDPRAVWCGWVWLKHKVCTVRGWVKGSMEQLGSPERMALQAILRSLILSSRRGKVY